MSACVWPRSLVDAILLERWGYSKKLLCLVVWGLSAAMVSSWHNKPLSPETEITPSEDGMRLPIGRGNWKRSCTQSSHPMQRTCTCTCTGVGAHSGWPSQCSAEERYNNNFCQRCWIEIPNSRDDCQRYWIEIPNSRDDCQRCWIEIPNSRDDCQRCWIEIQHRDDSSACFAE